MVLTQSTLEVSRLCNTKVKRNCTQDCTPVDNAVFLEDLD